MKPLTQKDFVILTVRLPKAQADSLTKIAKKKHITRSDLLRSQFSILEKYAGKS